MAAKVAMPTSAERSLGGRYWILPLLFLVVTTALAWIFGWDVSISRLLYVRGATQPWPLGNTGLSHFLEHVVWVPAVALAFVALGLTAGGLSRRRRSIARAGLILMLSLVLGPLLLANVVLKPYFGRPRPQDVVQFGGPDEFRPALDPTSEDHDSFPSGHAAAAFALLLPFFAFRRSARRLAIAALVAGLTLGVVIGFVRIAHGRHFFTDVLWSGGIVWFSGCAATALMEWLLPPLPREQLPESPDRREPVPLTPSRAKVVG